MLLKQFKIIAVILFSILLTGCHENLGSISYTKPVPEEIIAENVNIEVDDEYLLAGTLTIPATPSECNGFPAVILITGSSAHDRDNSKPSAPLSAYRPFRQIAETLSCNGIAVLRLDDRGIGSSTGRNIRRVSLSGRIDDISEAISFIANRSEVDTSKIGLLGLSEGASIAQMIAIEDDRIKFLVLISGIGYPGSSVIEHQINDKLAAVPNEIRHFSSEKLTRFIRI